MPSIDISDDIQAMAAFFHACGKQVLSRYQRYVPIPDGLTVREWVAAVEEVERDCPKTL